MKDKVKGIMLGLAVGSLVFGSIGFAAGSQINVKIQKAAVYFDGVKKSLPSGQETFTYKGQVYAPASFVASGIGKSYAFDSKSNSVYIGKQPAKTMTKADAEKWVRKYLKLDNKPAIYVEYDHDEGSEYVIHVYEVVIDDPSTGDGHTATWGWYYVNPKTGGIRSMF